MDTATAMKDSARSAGSARMTVTMDDGRNFTCDIEHGIGSASRTITARQLVVKFSDMAVPVFGQSPAGALIDLCRGIAAPSDAGDAGRAAG